jgi:hypothetical protein
MFWSRIIYPIIKLFVNYNYNETDKYILAGEYGVEVIIAEATLTLTSTYYIIFNYQKQRK